MRILFENVDFNSRTGPNGFGLKLAKNLIKDGNEIVSNNPDVCLSFIQSTNLFFPTVLRLDGIYFNSDQDWQKMNELIKYSYQKSESVIIQSHFDKDLVFKFFGQRENVFVIPNGTDIGEISKINPAIDPNRFPREKVWMCASSWRPHKRLDENIRLFQERADSDSVLLIAGSNIERNIFRKERIDQRIRILGDLSWEQMISCMKSSGNFLHLAWLDHCPNVVIDAKAAGCKVHVSNSGGTPEIIDEEDFLYEDSYFDFSPVSLYSPPELNFVEMKINKIKKFDFDISSSALKYYSVMKDCYEKNR